jgi:O-antigen/teichoic acid export membrane protein
MMGEEMEAGTEPRPEPRSLAGGALMAAGSRVAVTGAGAATTVVLARVLAPDGWARYFVAQSLLALLVAASTLGIEHGITYFVSAGRWRAGAAFAASLRVSAVVGVAVAALAVCVRVAVPSAFAGLSLTLTAVTAAALPFALAWLYTSYLALAVDRYEVSMLLPAAQALLTVAVAVPAGIVYGTNGAVVAAALAVGAVGASAVIWGNRELDGGEDAFRLRAAVAFGMKGYAANALQLVSYRLDVFILSAVASTAAVGRYALAVSLTSTLWILPRALSDVVFPRVARLSAESDDAAIEAVEAKSLRHVTLMVLPTVAAAAVALELLVVPIFGKSFRGAVNLSLILLPGAAAIAISTVLAASIVGRGRPGYSLLGSLIVTPLTVALYAIVIPRFGATGAAAASTLSYAGSLAVYAVFYRRTTGRMPFPLLVPTRSELADFKALASSVTERLGGNRT